MGLTICLTGCASHKEGDESNNRGNEGFRHQTLMTTMSEVGEGMVVVESFLCPQIEKIYQIRMNISKVSAI